MPVIIRLIGQIATITKRKQRQITGLLSRDFLICTSVSEIYFYHTKWMRYKQKQTLGPVLYASLASTTTDSWVVGCRRESDDGEERHRVF
uniref:Uncharacterized protein n=1 Tax=Rhizophora mucronata TaxID=61149 RepID=A0A2P2KAW3_RHIMU